MTVVAEWKTTNGRSTFVKQIDRKVRDLANAKKSRPHPEDPRFKRSLKALTDSVSELLDRAPVADITITRVVEVAGVTRPTFYQHFADVPDAARHAALVRLDAAFPVPQPPNGDEQLTLAAVRSKIGERALPVLLHLEQAREFYVRVLHGATTVAFMERVVHLVASRLLPEMFDAATRRGTAARKDLTAVVAGGVTWLVIGWLRGAPEVSASAMAERVANIAATLLAEPR